MTSKKSQGTQEIGKKVSQSRKTAKTAAPKKTAQTAVDKKTNAVTKKVASEKTNTVNAEPKRHWETQKRKLTPREQKIQEIKKALIAQRNELLSEAEEALNALPGQTIFPDMGDQASAEIDRTFMLRLRGREQRLLKKIEAAIEKIDSGSFGICDVCGEEISIKRLEARPVTTMCIFCKTEQEEEEKLRGA